MTQYTMNTMLSISMPLVSADSGLWYILAALVALYIVYLVRIKIACRMAKNRHRDPLGWVLLSIFVSPLLTWIILLIVGDQK